MTDLLFPELRLPDELIRDLDCQNPWWRSQPLPAIPIFRRWPYNKLKKL